MRSSISTVSNFHSKPISLVVTLLLYSLLSAWSNASPQRTTYARAEKCAKCHEDIYRKWLNSNHRKNIQIPDPDTDAIKGDFSENNTYTYCGISTRMFMKDRKYFIEVTESGRSLTTDNLAKLQSSTEKGFKGTYQVHYAIGNRVIQWYLTKLASGGLQILPIYWDISLKEWYDLAEGMSEEMHAAQSRSRSPRTSGHDSLKSGDFGYEPFIRDVSYWRRLKRTWNSTCWNCHASQFEKNYDPGADTWNTKVGDLSINCEACHGSAGRHIEIWTSLGEDQNQSARLSPSLVNDAMPKLGKFSPTQLLDVCAYCHAEKEIFSAGFQPGDDFLDFSLPVVIEDESKFWPNGQYKKLNYNYLAHIQSKCYIRGNLICTDCHDPHGSEHGASLIVPIAESADVKRWVKSRVSSERLGSWRSEAAESRDQRSDEALHPASSIASSNESKSDRSSPGPSILPQLTVPRDSTDLLCTRCHLREKLYVKEHTHHPPDSDGSRCIECHMPKISIGKFETRDHRISVPVPRNTVKFKIPNACNRCHREESPQWASEWVEKWYKNRQEDYVRLAEIIQLGMKASSARGAGLDASATNRAVEGLVDVLSDQDRSAVFRASAAALLGAMRNERATKPLMNALRDPSPLVRAKAILALISMKHRRSLTFIEALSDDNLCVRALAAAGLISLRSGPLRLSPEQRRLFDSASKEYESYLRLYPEFTMSHLSLARLYQFQGRLAEARKEREIADKVQRTEWLVIPNETAAKE